MYSVVSRRSPSKMKFTDNSSEPPTPVGVTIAYKRKKDGAIKSTPPKTKEKEAKKAVDSKQTQNTNNYSWQVFIEGATLYTACLVLPTVMGCLVRAYEQGWISLAYFTDTTSTLATIEQDENSWSNLAYEQAAYYFCENHSTESAASTLSSYIGTNWYWCPGDEEADLDVLSSPLSPDAESTDFGYVAIMSLTLAMIRVAVVQILVPLQDVEGLHAWVRSKSVHLLSSDYAATMTPTSPRKPIFETDTTGHDQLLLPELDMNRQSHPSIGLSFDDTEHEEDGHWDSMHGSENRPDPARLFREVSSQLEEERLLQEEESPKRRLHAAPRYATAVFRLMYSTVAIVMAWIYFHDANFWPWYVGGGSQSATKHCWDLSGGLANVLDSDFDHHNRVLKRYFLWQASYHWHSGAFHMLSMIILIVKPRQQQGPRRFLGFAIGSTAYMRSLFQHVLLLAMISTAYIFSSLRRLVTIGMFAFDISSWCLHLLQVCMNAPEDSRLSQPRVVRKLHKFVMVVFAVTRFGIWPALWYSSVFESQSWLLQLEQTIVPGAALAMKVIMNILFLLLMILNLVYGRRLLRHPHLGRITRYEVEE